MTAIMTIIIVAAATAAAPATPKSDYSPEETRKIVSNYGDCIIESRRRRAQASQAIIANADNNTLIKKYPDLLDGNCLPVSGFSQMQATFTGDEFRYAIADALVRAELANTSIPDLSKVPPLDHEDPGGPPASVDKNGKPLNPKAYQELLDNYHLAQAFTFLSRYGECVVRADPTAARALLLTQPGSVEESSRFAALQTALGSCLPIQPGQKLAMGKVAVRGTIAINYYRLAEAALDVRPERAR
jgi:hypothetical protein